MNNLNMNNENNIEFKIDTSEALLDKVHTYFKNEPRLKAIKVNQSIDDNINEENIILKFNIEKIKQPIYKDISCFDDIKLVIDYIKETLDKLLENIKPILNDKDSDENTKKALRAIVNSFMNFKKNVIRLDRGTDKELDLCKNKEKFIENLNRLLKDRIIKDCIQPIYQGMKHSENHIYDNLLIYINEWLQILGIYTLELNEMDKIDDLNLTYIDKINVENTKDYSKHEVIKDIIQYPYIFDEYIIVCEGEVVIWRFE